jgi:hypothetical protein
VRAVVVYIFRSSVVGGVNLAVLADLVHSIGRVCSS